VGPAAERWEGEGWVHCASLRNLACVIRSAGASREDRKPLTPTLSRASAGEGAATIDASGEKTPFSGRGKKGTTYDVCIPSVEKGTCPSYIARSPDSA
jgi:hypothetical protein